MGRGVARGTASRGHRRVSTRRVAPGAGGSHVTSDDGYACWRGPRAATCACGHRVSLWEHVGRATVGDSARPPHTRSCGPEPRPLSRLPQGLQTESLQEAQNPPGARWEGCILNASCPQHAVLGLHEPVGRVSPVDGEGVHPLTHGSSMRPRAAAPTGTCQTCSPGGPGGGYGTGAPEAVTLDT